MGTLKIKMTERKIFKVMFLCTANSCRSQMAEGLARHMGKELFEPYSAGLFNYYVHPMAKAVLKEIGIDISGQKSKAINEELLKNMDVVITLCGNAEAFCPATSLQIKRIHWPIDDPVGTAGTEEEILNEFRKTRDKIKNRIETLLNRIKEDDL